MTMRVRGQAWLKLLLVVAILAGVFVGVVVYLIHSVAASLANASHHVEKAIQAAQNIDPLGWTKVLEERQALQGEYNNVARLASGRPIEASLVAIAKHRIQLTFPVVEGAFYVDAYIDTPERWLLHSAHLMGGIASPTLKWPDAIPPPLCDPYPTIKERFRDSFVSAASTVERQWASSFPIVPLPQQRAVELNDQVLTTGQHFIYVVLTPIADSSAGRGKLTVDISEPGRAQPFATRTLLHDVSRYPFRAPIRLEPLPLLASVDREAAHN